MELHLVLLDFWDIKELEAMDAIRRDGIGINEASLLAIAYHEPNRLQRADAALYASVQRFNGEGVAPVRDDAALRAYAEAMIAKYSQPAEVS